MRTIRQSRGKNRERTQATCAKGHSPPGRTWVRWSRIRYSCFRPNAGGTQSMTSRCTMRPTRFFDARTCSAIPSAARTPCSIGLAVSVPTNDSRRASTTITTSPDRSPSYSFVKRRSSRAEAFQLIRRTSSPAAYSRTPQNSVPAPICLEGTCPNHGRVRRGWSFVRRRSSIVGATTRRPSLGRAATSAARPTCQRRSASPATRSTRDAAARPLESGVRMSRHLGHGDLPQDVGEDRRGPYASNPWIRLQDDAMGERGHRDRLHVVRCHEVPSRDCGPSARHLEECEGATRARADLDLRMGPRRSDDVDHVPFDRGFHVDVLDRGLQAANLLGRRHRLDRGVVPATFPAPLDDLDLLLPRRIADVNLQEKPVHLSFRERIRAFMLNRILRRDHEERPVQVERLALQGSLATPEE